jgi:hypothetical protein
VACATLPGRAVASIRVYTLSYFASNIAFIAYGYFGQLTPVLLLHSLLMVVNAYHVLQLTLLQGIDTGQREIPAPQSKRAGREVRPF